MSDIEIARSATLKPISEIADSLNIPSKEVMPLGHDKAKLNLEWLDEQPKKNDSKLILVTAINPTPAGEGKTTTSVGLGDGLNRIEKKQLFAFVNPLLVPVLV